MSIERKGFDYSTFLKLLVEKFDSDEDRNSIPEIINRLVSRSENIENITFVRDSDKGELLVLIKDVDERLSLTWEIDQEIGGEIISFLISEYNLDHDAVQDHRLTNDKDGIISHVQTIKIWQTRILSISRKKLTLSL